MVSQPSEALSLCMLNASKPWRSINLSAPRAMRSGESARRGRCDLEAAIPSSLRHKGLDADKPYDIRLRVSLEIWQKAGISSDKASRTRRVASYYGCTFLFTHALAAGYLLCGGSWRRLDSFAFANLVMWVPGLVAAGTARWLYREPVLRVLGLSLRFNRWLLVAWLLPLLLSGATLLLGLALPGTAYSASLAGLSTRFDLSAEQMAGLAPAIGSLAPIWTLVAQGLILGPSL